MTEETETPKSGAVAGRLDGLVMRIDQLKNALSDALIYAETGVSVPESRAAIWRGIIYGN